MIMHTPKIDLYPHNQETYGRIIEMWKTSNRVAVIQATGTGKTYLMLRCMVDFEPSKKVVLAPSNYILDQLLSKANGNLPNTELLTYAKLAFMTKEEITGLNPSLIVLDEFHRCGADKWELGVDMLIKMFPNAKILGTSATPIRYLDNARDMSDELFEGNIAVNLSLSDAIVKGILPMPKYISALYTFDEEINNLQAKIERSDNNEETKKEYLKEVESLKNKLNRSKGIPEILRKHVADIGGKFVVFCKDRQHLNEMETTVKDWFEKANIGKTVEMYRVVTGELENNKELSVFRENKNSKNVRLLFTVDMLNEGVHIDDVTGVILLRPTVSPIIFYQQIGRSIQAGNSSNPLIFDFVNNFNNIRVNTFIKDLNDSRELEISKRNSGKEVETSIPEFTVVDETNDAITMFNSLEDDMIMAGVYRGSHEEQWGFIYNQLKLYKEEFGNCMVMHDYKTNSCNLGTWVSVQRAHFKKGKLTKERVDRLNDIGFVWEALITLEWDLMYDKLIEKNIEVNIADGNLYSWVATQRKRYKKGELELKKIEKLNSINFSWEPLQDKWNLMYDKLSEFKKENGYIPVHRKTPMGYWILNQKQNNRDGILSEEKIKLLDLIDFPWELKNIDRMFENFIDELISYKKEFGDLNIPVEYRNGKSWLGRKFSKYKTNYNNGKLSREKIIRMESIGVNWINRIGGGGSWEKTFLEYKHHLENKLKLGHDLSTWMYRQRKLFKSGSLLVERIEKLEQIGVKLIRANKEDKPNETSTMESFKSV